jgi:hypothetical protein
MTWPRATRNLKHADAGQLTAMQNAAAALLEQRAAHQPARDHRLVPDPGGDRGGAEGQGRASADQPASASAHRHSPAAWAGGQLDALPG